MDELKPYPEYKDSGVEWLGDVPVGWEVRRQGAMANLRVSNVDKHVVEGEEPVRLCNYVDVYKNDLIEPGMRFSKGSARAEEVSQFQLIAGDVVITKDSESWEDIASPALVTHTEENLICGYHLAILRPLAGISGSYLLRVTQSEPVADQYRVAAKGVTRFGLTHGGIRTVRIPVPPKEDQAVIVRYLDDVDSRIQRLIAAKERMAGDATAQSQRRTGLLVEYRTRLISDVVTGRLDVREAVANPPNEGA